MVDKINQKVNDQDNNRKNRKIKKLFFYHDSEFLLLVFLFLFLGSQYELPKNTYFWDVIIWIP
jgi:hypothetical protein